MGFSFQQANKLKASPNVLKIGSHSPISVSHSDAQVFIILCPNWFLFKVCHKLVYVEQFCHSQLFMRLLIMIDH